MKPSVLHVMSLSAFLLSLTLSASAQVRLHLSSEVAAPLKSGEKFLAKLTADIEPGWHISSLTQPDGGPLRTEISLAENQPVKLHGPITGPKPHVEHSKAFGIEVESHEGRVEFTLPLVATADLAPGTKLHVLFTYQACTEETCLMPQTEKVTGTVTLREKPAPRSPKPSTP